MSTPNSNSDEGDAAGGMDQSGESEPARGHERIEELEALRDVLRAENDRLRSDYARARAVSYRRTALALAAIGVAAVAGGVAFPDVRAVLFVTGSIGLFSAVMTWYLTPGRIVPIGVSESVYDAAATTLTDLRDELGLQAVTVYVPVGDRVRGFVPRHREFDVPENVTHAFPVDKNVAHASPADGDDHAADAARGLTFAPSGQGLTREVDRIRTTGSPGAAIDALEQIGDSLVEHFEVADRVAVEEGTDSRQFVVSVDGAAFGALTRLDHPIVSALACAVAQSVGEPVVVDSVGESTVTLELMENADR